MMSGKVVGTVILPHACDPGWTWRPLREGEGLTGLPITGGRYGIPPSPWDYPEGTVWLCGCGQVWVSQGMAPGNRHGVLSWRQESRRERRRRLGLRWWQR